MSGAANSIGLDNKGPIHAFSNVVQWDRLFQSPVSRSPIFTLSSLLSGIRRNGELLWSR